MSNLSQDERLLRQLMSSRLANGAGLIMMALARLGEARAFALMRQCCLEQRAFFKDLQGLVNAGLVIKRGVQQGTLYRLSEDGKRMISCHESTAQAAFCTCKECIFNKRRMIENE
ncbi:MAG: hypothetical protein R3Y56_07515 [Akkermansia sp.]